MSDDVLSEIIDEESMENEEDGELAEILECATVSPDWKESYADDAYIFPRLHEVRMSFVDHPPRFFNGKKGSFINRKADVIMAREAFLEFAELVAEVARDLEEMDKIE